MSSVETTQETRYDRNTINSPNPLVRYSHRKRISVAIDLARQFASDGARVIDFGAGPGLFLHRLGQSRPDLKLMGYDLFVEPGYPGLTYVKSFGEVASASIDVMTAFEVCEHLYDHEVAEMMQEAKRVLKPGGTLIVSVPIMYGLAIVPKVMNYIRHKRSFAIDYSVVDTVKSMFGVPISRPESPRATHRGFDFRTLRRELANNFDIDESFVSPLRGLPWWCNSQVFLICSQKA